MQRLHRHKCIFSVFKNPDVYAVVDLPRGPVNIVTSSLNTVASPAVQSSIGTDFTGNDTVSIQSHPEHQCQEWLSISADATGDGTVTIQFQINDSPIRIVQF